MTEIRRRPMSAAQVLLQILSYTRHIFCEMSLKRTFNFFVRSLRHFPLVGRWLSFLHGMEESLHLGAPPIDMVRKAFGAYFSMAHSFAERENLLEGHYNEAVARGMGAVVQRHWDGESIRLAKIEGKKQLYRLWLQRADKSGARHEGEWTFGIEIERAKPLILFRLTFILARDDQGQTIVAIGGLQGPARDISKAELVTATRDLGGLRPKDALLLVAAGLSDALGQDRMLAISNDNHPINYRGKRRQKKMLTDYDDYWTERGGHPGGPFGFILPVKHPAQPQKDEKKREAHKRSFFEAGRSIVHLTAEPASNG